MDNEKLDNIKTNSIKNEQDQDELSIQKFSWLMFVVGRQYTNKDKS